MIWEEIIISKIPYTTPEEDDSRTNEERLETALPEVSASWMSTEYVEVHICIGYGYSVAYCFDFCKKIKYG